MTRVGKLTRRTFLVGSTAVAGGVAFGVYLAKKPIPNPLLEGLAEGEAALTPFVKIDADGITLITPRADMGQGAYSIQAYLIAEELDIDPATARLSPGLPGPAYHNATILAEGVPYPAYDDSFVAESLRSLSAVPAKLFSVQVTGGSSTIPDGFDRLRTAGAIARETLKEAAARRTGIARSNLKTADGFVLLPAGGRIAYTDLAAEAAQIAPVADVSPRPSSEWKYLGTAALPRLDMARKCTGTEVYGIDLEFDDMLHATVRANPAIGAGLARLDTARAENMRGLHRIIPMSQGVGVIADNTWRAFQAADALDISWKAPAYPATSDGLFHELEAALNAPDFFDHRQRDDGNVDRALSDGTVITADYRVPYLAHAPMEPMNAVVRVQADAVEIWTGTQIPVFVRDRAARIAGVKAANVKVHVLPMGGSFGHRLEMTHVEQAVELAMAVPGRHLKLTWSREEDMTHDYPRPASVARARGAVADGKVIGFDLSVSQSAMAPEWLERLSGRNLPGPDATITTGAWDQPFAIPNYRVTGYRAPAMVPVSSWRSVGASGNGFYHDCFLDELIHAAGADPLAERMRLCMHDPSRKVLEAVGEMSGWNGELHTGGRGRGVGFCMSFGVPCAQVVDVVQTEDGIRIEKVYVAVDVGEVLDPTNLEAQVFGGVIWGLGHAMNCELTYDDHMPDQSNFYDFTGMRLYQAPEIIVRALSNGSAIRGIGEPAVPPAAPALANAIFAATGQRIRELPLHKHIDFV
ncbi:xanthine dehydrogenase family protein molybdopterin-binding subunit [Phaeobacter sp. B1627]|uniref:xanthine dehydrogenase family protein molybdopterin-binding subunit n=1 Tax=Phaeobacter sp. B1627 TaxID=2583809 RepID=UPI0011191741|nr:molybdopterin cofactor-binding domain-containing protein [Phaeobacter sp. B1627]TNJ47453.1 xanthine dehydrogenase family protein molybdopterin-binding subunit [Phaeobacter sp. B1627]